MNDVGMNPLLSELQKLSAIAKDEDNANSSPAGGDFANLLKKLWGSVNQAQHDSTQLAQNFELAESNAPDLAEVMIALQKARLTFQATLQVRNKLVSAYQDVMNMPL